MAGGVGEPDGIIGRNFIEIGGDDVAVIGELAFVPARTLNPCAGSGGGDFVADEGYGFGDGLTSLSLMA